MSERSLFIPVVLGTPRKGRNSEKVANYVLEQVRKRKDVETKLIDIRELGLPTDDAGEGIKQPEFSNDMKRADAIILVVPEYNHGYPGLLKHALDTNLREYIHKAAGICGVSAGIFGGARVVENLVPVLRELGLVTIFWDGNFPNAGSLFDAEGRMTDPGQDARMDQFLKELVWMARTLRHGREQISLE